MLHFDAMLIPGGGIRPDGTLPPWARRRFDRAVERYQGEYLIPLSAGTVHRPPPFDDHGFPLLEAHVGGRYLLERGIPADRILPEAASYDTIGNAFFSRVMHVEPLALRRLLVITSAFHMPRTELIFRWVYGLPPSPYCLTFEAVPDEGIEPAALAARRQRERQSVDRLRRLAPTIQTIPQLHHWLFTEHLAYTLARPPTDAGLALGTY
jgi:uncharacterized SAM-binding protein YcdF (DUF218 family)